jgi:hypothetical protein
MDTETYLLASRQIQERLAAQRRQLFPEPGTNGSHAHPFSWWPLVKQLLVRDTSWSALLSGLVSTGVGYALSRWPRRYSLSRFTPQVLTRFLY